MHITNFNDFVGEVRTIRVSKEIHSLKLNKDVCKTCAPAMGLFHRGNKIISHTFQES